MADFEIKAHDRLPSIRAQLLNAEDESPIDLTNAQSVSFIMTTAVGAVPKINALAVIETDNTAVPPITPKDGIVRYDWAAVDTALPGEFLGEWEVTWVGGKQQSFPTGSYHSISILADLDGA